LKNIWAAFRRELVVVLKGSYFFISKLLRVPIENLQSYEIFKFHFQPRKGPEIEV